MEIFYARLFEAAPSVPPSPNCGSPPKLHPVFLLRLTYTASLEEVDALMRPHMAWLRKQYAAGRFVVSGRQVPRVGGVIIAHGDDREAIEALAASDPFVRGGVATVEVTQFEATRGAL